MFIRQISEHFFELTDVLSNALLDTVVNCFSNRDTWIKHNDAGNNIREEFNISMTDQLSLDIQKELGTTKLLAEKEINSLLHPNSPQLWYDYPGYISGMHKDFSPNLSVNVQVYLTDSTDIIGTHCYDGSWYSVPYKRNCGYMLISPTTVEHGMKHPVVDQRMSLYQSFRKTVEPVNQW